jgi:site-specific recombinase XerD
MGQSRETEIVVQPTALPETAGAIVAVGEGPLSAEIAAARSYRTRAKSENTLRAYGSDWRQFEDWCWARELEPLPALPEGVATYLAALALAGRADSTITRHLAAIGWKHRQNGIATPMARDTHMLIADTLSGIRREQRARPTRKKAAITAKDLARMIACADGQGTRSTRDRAVLALCLAAALQRCGAPSWSPFSLPTSRWSIRA